MGQLKPFDFLLNQLNGFKPIIGADVPCAMDIRCKFTVLIMSISKAQAPLGFWRLRVSNDFPLLPELARFCDIFCVTTRGINRCKIMIGPMPQNKGTQI